MKKAHQNFAQTHKIFFQGNRPVPNPDDMPDAPESDNKPTIPDPIETRCNTFAMKKFN